MYKIIKIRQINSLKDCNFAIQFYRKNARPFFYKARKIKKKEISWKLVYFKFKEKEIY
jgi:hypothetical protein